MAGVKTMNMFLCSPRGTGFGELKAFGSGSLEGSWECDEEEETGKEGNEVYNRSLGITQALQMSTKQDIYRR